MCGRWRSATSEPTKIRSPRWRSTIPGSTAVASRLAPIRWIWICDSNSSVLISYELAEVGVAGAGDEHLDVAEFLGGPVHERLHRVGVGDVEAEARPPRRRRRGSCRRAPRSFSTRRAPSATGKPRAASSIAVAAPIPDGGAGDEGGPAVGEWVRSGAFTGLLHGDGQVGEPADVAGVDADGVGLVDLVAADALERARSARPGLPSGPGARRGRSGRRCRNSAAWNRCRGR